MTDYILAIDQGTTSSRALTYDLKGNIISVAQREITQYFPKPGWVEHDPYEILKTQINVAKEVIESSGGINGLLSVAITNQRETTVVWDRSSGDPVYRAIVWQCRRSSEICDELKNNGYEEVIRKKTGLVIDAYFSATKLMWIFRNIPEVRRLADNGRLLFGTIDSWLIYKLTGEHLTDFSNASRTMLFNIYNLSWDKDLLEMMEIPQSILPDPRPSFSKFGNVKKEIFGKEVPLYGVIGDQQSSLLGQGCISQGMVKNTYGTGCFVLMNTGDKPRFSEKGLLTTCCWGDSKRITYALEGSVFIGGAVVQWLRDGLKIIKDSSESEPKATEVDDNGGVYFVPAFVGLGAPYWDMNARGTIVGLTRGSRDVHIVRAALEAIAYQSYDVIKAMESDSSIDVKELRVDGGASRNNFLMQFQSNILNKKILRPEVLESTSRGAFFASAITSGLMKLEDIDSIVRIARTFTPEMSEDGRNKLLNGWNRAVKKAIL